MPRYCITAIGTYGYVLKLNSMMGRLEDCKDFGPFDTVELARAFYDGEKVEVYREEGPNMWGPEKKTYTKTFRKGGPLEFFNPLEETEWTKPSYYGQGLYEVLLSVDNALKQGPALL